MGEHAAAVDVPDGVYSRYVRPHVAVRLYSFHVIFHARSIKCESLNVRRAPRGYQYFIGFNGLSLSFALESNTSVCYRRHRRLHEKRHAFAGNSLTKTARHIAVEHRQTLFKILNYRYLTAERSENRSELHSYNPGADNTQSCGNMVDGKQFVGCYHGIGIERRDGGQLGTCAGGYDDIVGCIFLFADNNGMRVFKAALTAYKSYPRLRHQVFHTATQLLHNLDLPLFYVAEIKVVSEI